MKKWNALLLFGIVALSVVTPVSMVETEVKAVESAGQEEDALWDSYQYGVLYQNGEVTYGPAVMPLPGFSLLEGGEDDPRDYLISENSDMFFYVSSQFEVMVSYENSDAQSILDSYSEEQGYSDVSMINFEKSYLGDYPTIRYTVKATVDSLEEYITELILMDQEECSKTIRLQAETTSEAAKDTMELYFDLVELTEEPLTYEDTGSFAVTKIVAK